MNIRNFHDGHFEGLRIGLGNLVDLYLRTQDGRAFILVLHEVDALTLTDVKAGNIIFDLVLRKDEQLTSTDIAELHSVDVDAPEAKDLLERKRELGLKLLEINSSYGAQGLVLFRAFEVRQSTPANE
jgi:hypothetical protein